MEEIGCKHCGNVIKYDINAYGDRFELRVRDGGRIEHGYGGNIIKCKKCGHKLVEIKVEKI